MYRIPSHCAGAWCVHVWLDINSTISVLKININLYLCVAIRNQIRNVALFPALVLDNVVKESKRMLGC